MENASKALIIAGAILLAILLISLGIMIFNQAQDTVNNSGMSQAELQAFNNKFLKYEGSNKKGSEVKALINEVIASNADTNNSKRRVQVKIGSSGSYAEPTSTNGILTTSTYSVIITYASATDAATTGNNTSTGAVYKIAIQ